MNTAPLKNHLKNYRLYSCIDTEYYKELCGTLLNSLSIIRTLPGCGEVYFKILYYCYFSTENCISTYEIIEALNNDNLYLSERSYFRKKNEAIKLMAQIIEAQKH